MLRIYSPAEESRSCADPSLISGLRLRACPVQREEMTFILRGPRSAGSLLCLQGKIKIYMRNL